MVTMFIVGVLLALAFGVAAGILYTQAQRSIFTKKFHENLQNLVKAYEEQMRQIQENDRKIVQSLQDGLQKSLTEVAKNINPNDIPPPRGNYN